MLMYVAVTNNEVDRVVAAVQLRSTATYHSLIDSRQQQISAAAAGHY